MACIERACVAASPELLLPAPTTLPCPPQTAGARAGERAQQYKQKGALQV